MVCFGLVCYQILSFKSFVGDQPVLADIWLYRTISKNNVADTKYIFVKGIIKMRWYDIFEKENKKRDDMILLSNEISKIYDILRLQLF